MTLPARPLAPSAKRIKPRHGESWPTHKARARRRRRTQVATVKAAAVRAGQ